MNPSQGGGIQRKQALIAQLLRDQNSEDGDDASSSASGHATGDLSSLLGRIDTFFAGAGNAPAPRSIEVRESKTKSAKGETTASEGNESEGDEQEIHLNLLLGVLQAKEAKPDNKAGFSKDGLLLPGKQAEKLLEAEKMRDSKTLLSMMSALGNTTGENTTAEEGGSEDDNDDDGTPEGCMIFDAEDMSSSDSDDGDRLGIITRQPAPTKGKRLIEEM